MKVLLDTNILLDALQERQPFDTDAKEILRRGQSGDLECCFTANAATDIFYLYSKARNVKQARTALEFLLGRYSVVDVTHGDCTHALKSEIVDFEDALVAECAKKAGVDYIVTRDDEFLRSRSPIKVITTNELLALLG